MAGIWKTWMTVWCWGVVAFGVLLASVAVPGADGLARTVFTAFSGDAARAASFDLPAVRFGLGLQGALSIGWGLTMLGAVAAAHSIGDRAVGAPLWRSLTLALAVWYVIDSAISVQTGFALNAVSNTALMIGYLIPVLASGVLGGRAKVATA